MNKKEIQKYFTESYILAQLTYGYKLNFDKKSYLTNNGINVVFSVEDYYKYVSKPQNIILFAVTEEEIKELIENFDFSNNIEKIRYYISDNQYVILEFNPEFFELKGIRNKKLRYYRNYYEKMSNLKVYNHLNNNDDLTDFLKKWKKSRLKQIKKPVFSYDKIFITKYALKDENKYINHFFYIEGELIGFSIIEKLDNHNYNHLFRKSNIYFSHLALYIDYYVYNEIKNKVNEPFIVSLGNTGGFKNLLKEKTENFPVYFVFNCKTLSLEKIYQGF